MIIQKVMTKKVITLKADYSMLKAAQILYKNKISGAPVVNDKDKIIGIISEKDIFRAMHPSFQEYIKEGALLNNFEDMEKGAQKLDKKSVKKFMNRDILVVSPVTPLMKAGSLMLAKGYNRIPVVENNKLVGLVSRREIYHNIFKKYLGL